MAQHTALVEASILQLNSRDGSQRYVEELLRGLHVLTRQPANAWQIDVHLGMRRIVTLQHVIDNILNRPEQEHTESSAVKGSDHRENILRNLSARLFNRLTGVLPDAMLTWLQQCNRSLQSFFWAHFKKIDFSRYDLVHLTLPQFYHTLADCNSTLLTSVFDLSHVHYPQFHMRNNIVCTEKGLGFALQHDASFLAISEATRQDFLARFPGFDPARIHTVYCGRDSGTFRPVTDTPALQLVKDRYRLPDRPFFLSLSTLEPRKNLINSIRAFLHLVETEPELDVCFVIAGRAGWKFEDIFGAAQQDLDRIVFTGFIAEEDLPAVYSSALALSYVSYYEGFGLPPLEAMSCGTPVIYGNNSSMPEVIDGAGLPADPDDVEAIALQFKAIASDATLRTTLSGNALAQANKFSWESMAEQTLAVYQQATG